MVFKGFGVYLLYIQVTSSVSLIELLHEINFSHGQICQHYLGVLGTCYAMAELGRLLDRLRAPRWLMAPVSLVYVFF